MARRARLSVAGGVFHVVSRFAGDAWVLDREGAREAYLHSLEHAVQTSDVQVLAYCLMSNHVHLVVIQGERPLERFTKSLHTGFAGWVRRQPRIAKGKRVARGAVFADRPRTVLVDKDSHLLELVRYVHNNPVRAGVCRFARASTWSSHQAYIGRVRAPSWLRVGFVLDLLGRKPSVAMQRLDDFVNEVRTEARRPELSGVVSPGEVTQVRAQLGNAYRLSDGVLGDEAFVRRVRQDAERATQALSKRGSERREGAVGRPSVQQLIDATLLYCEVDPIELSERPKSRKSSRVKRLVTWMWVHEYQGKHIEVARALGLDSGVISHHYRQAVLRAGDYDEEASAVAALIRKRSKPARRGKVTAASDGATRVRYHVDVDETE